MQRRVSSVCRRFLLIVASLSWLPSCGGRAALEADGADGDGDEVGGDSDPGNAAGSPSGPADRPEPTVDYAGMVLPDCVPGFLPGTAGDTPCRYMHDRRCYTEEDAVCACACPGQLCILSGFQWASGPVNVVCQARP